MGADNPITINITNAVLELLKLVILRAKSNITVIDAAAISETINLATNILEAKKTAGIRKIESPTP